MWIVVLAQAALWLLVALLIYRSPPADLATVLAFGREYQVGTDMGPPLAFWLADIAFRAAGNHVFGVYLLAQVCAVVTFWSFFRSRVPGRRPAGGARQAALDDGRGVLFSRPGIRPAGLARPLWALLLLHSWQLIGQKRHSAWFARSIGLRPSVALTTPAAIGMIGLVAAFALATARRRTLMTVDPPHAAARDRRAGAA
jgi:hypothetical protein